MGKKGKADKGKAKNAGGAGANPASAKKLEKLAKKLEKEKEKWKLYVAYLQRHITIAISKYIDFERKEFEQFKQAIEKARRLDPKDREPAKSLKKLKLRSELLEKELYTDESEVVKRYLCMIARMRGLFLIAKDFTKIAKKAKFKKQDKLTLYFTLWQFYLAPATDLSKIVPNDVNPEHRGMKWARWACLMRTVLNNSLKFLQQAVILTNIELTASPELVDFSLSNQQQEIRDIIQEEFKAPPLPAPKGMKMLKAVPTGTKKADEFRAKLPGEDEFLTFVIPKKFTAKGKKGGGGKGEKKDKDKKGKKNKK